MREVTPGQYSITVTNVSGTSNPATFTVTGSGGSTLSVTGLSAPSSLAIGQAGTWTVQVSAQAGTNLRYSVVWGDEVYYSAGIMAHTQSSVQASATFTHAYERSGTYTPIFTVTDDFGRSVSTSGTVTVTPLY